MSEAIEVDSGFYLNAYNRLGMLGIKNVADIGCGVGPFVDIMARAMEVGYGGDEFIPAIDRQAWATLNLTPKLLETAIEQFLEEMDDSGFWMEF